MMDSRLPIGIFDSGVGGLTVLKAVNRLMPNEHLIYLGDTARLPYGTKSRATIGRYTLMAARKLAAQGIKMLIIACNTATSAALPMLAQELTPMPVLGVIEPGAAAAAAATRSRHIGVIATEATINERAYQNAIARLLPDCKVAAKACPLLVPLAEEGWTDGAIAEAVIARYLAGIFSPDAGAPDTLLLGCTHFPLFRRPLEKIAGPGVAIVDSASTTAQRAAARLGQAALLNPDSSQGGIRFLTTDSRARFAATGGRFLGRALSEADVELVDL